MLIKCIFQVCLLYEKKVIGGIQNNELLYQRFLNACVLITYY